MLKGMAPTIKSCHYQGVASFPGPILSFSMLHADTWHGIVWKGRLTVGNSSPEGFILARVPSFLYIIKEDT